MIRFSFFNFATAATIAGSTTFADALWPAANVLLFGRPFIRTYSPDLSAQRLTLDFGATTSAAVIALLNPNFLTVTVQGNGTDTWGSPGYTSGALTMARSGNDRVHHGHRPTVPVPFAQRFLSLSIPNQVTTDGATVFRVGPIWAGLVVSPPRDLLMDPDEAKLEPREDTKTADGRVLDRLILDDAAWTITAKRVALGETELAAWREIDRQWSATPGQAALVLSDLYPERTYLMRQMSVSKWRHGRVFSESEMQLVEVTNG